MRPSIHNYLKFRHWKIVGFALLGNFLSGCQHEPILPPQHVKPKTLYSNPVPLSLVNELPCDSIPQEDYQGFRDSGFVYQLAQNPHNQNQWVYTKVHPPKRWTYAAITTIHFADLATRENYLIDSLTITSTRNPKWGGGYILYDDFSNTFLFNPKTKEHKAFHGTRTSISPNGTWILTDRFRGGNRIELIKKDGLETVMKWKLNDMDAEVIWENDDSYVYLSTTNSYSRFNITDSVVTPLFESQTRIGSPTMWTESDKYILSSIGQLIDLEYQEVIDFKFEGFNCNNRTYEHFINLKSQGKILALKDYRDFDHEDRSALYYREFHIMNYDGSNEERIQLNF